MPGFIERIDRDQPTLFPELLEDWIGEDHLFADELDLAGRLVPDHETIADFRRDESAAIAGTCAQFVELCRRLGTLKGAWVAIDGRKFRAAGSRDRNFTKRMIANRLAHLDADVSRYINDMVRTDWQESRHESGQYRPTLRAHPAGNRAVEGNGCSPVRGSGSPDVQTDPDARATATSARRSGLVGDNIQSAVDTETHLIVA